MRSELNAPRHTSLALRRSLRVGVIIGLVVLLIGLTTDSSIIGLAVGLPLAALSFGFVGAVTSGWWRVVLSDFIVSSCLFFACLITAFVQVPDMLDIAVLEAIVVAGATFAIGLLIGTWGYAGGRADRQLDEIRRGFCPVCQYSLLGLEADPCPECGEICFARFGNLEHFRQRLHASTETSYDDFELVEAIVDHPLVRWIDLIDCLRYPSHRRFAARELAGLIKPTDTSREHLEDPAFWESALAAQSIDPFSQIRSFRDKRSLS